MIAFAALLITGGEIVISHPRFYWGEVGNVNVRPLFTLPIPSSRGTVPTGYNFVMPDENGWSRSLHFQAAWLLVLAGLVYGIAGLWSGHFRRNLVPERRDWTGRATGRGSQSICAASRLTPRKRPRTTFCSARFIWP